jgi:hypothetical protein
LPDDRPLLFLDVDGTLLPELPGDLDDVSSEGLQAVRARGREVWVPLHLRRALPELARRYEIAWCTDWEEGANVTVAPLFELPDDLAVIRHDPAAVRWWKLEGVDRFAGDRPLAWADDRMRVEARRWAAQRAADTLLLQPAPDRGLTPDDVAQLAAFAGPHAGR